MLLHQVYVNQVILQRLQSGGSKTLTPAVCSHCAVAVWLVRIHTYLKVSPPTLQVNYRVFFTSAPSWPPQTHLLRCGVPRVNR